MSVQGGSPRGRTLNGGSPRARSISPSRERIMQQEYWKEHTSTLDGATVNAMMLDSQAASLDLQERPEVLSMLGSVADKRVVELGAGIGRFTGALAATAKSVLAVDFMENLIAENIKIHGHRQNIQHEVADATMLDLEENTFDVVFSNWLLMYLDDVEVSNLASDALAWVSEGGTIFFRESCFKQSGDKPRKNNPTHYRNPREYFEIFDKVENEEPDGRFSHFELISCKCVDTYVRVKQNGNQICWKWKKVITETSQWDQLRHFLDTQQYSTNSILRYERIFGTGFVSTGGVETTQVTFEIADITTSDSRSNFYDVIYSRDTILHIKNKAELFSKFYDMLKPGGRLLISDYCKAEAQPSPDFAAYIKQRGYHLYSVDSYGKTLTEAGFQSVIAEDRTWQMKESLERELKSTTEDREKFIAEFSETDYNYIVNGWKDKLGRLGEQKWGLFRAVKQANEE